MAVSTIKRLITGSVAFVVVGLIVIQLAWSQPYDPQSTVNSSVQFKKLNILEDSIGYAYSGNPNKPGLIFIHGTPGGWAAFHAYLANDLLQKHFFMVSVDRPGWGESQTTDKKNNGIFKHQATNISKIFEQYGDKQWIVIGHSLGASLAPQVALEAPQSVSGLLLLAGSLNPRLGSPRWYNYAAKTWVISKMVGKEMTQSNREIMKLRKQLTIMNEQIESTSLDIDVVVMQGLKDKLVSPKNPRYVTESWQDNFKSVEVIEIPDAGHFLPWQQSNEVVRAIELLSN